MSNPTGSAESRVAVLRADLAEVLQLLRDYGKPCDRANCDALTCVAVRRLEGALDA